MGLEQNEFSKMNSHCHISPADLTLMNYRTIKNSSKVIFRVSVRAIPFRKSSHGINNFMLIRSVHNITNFFTTVLLSNIRNLSSL